MTLQYKESNHTDISPHTRLLDIYIIHFSYRRNVTRNSCKIPRRRTKEKKQNSPVLYNSPTPCSSNTKSGKTPCRHWSKFRYKKGWKKSPRPPFVQKPQDRTSRTKIESSQVNFFIYVPRSYRFIRSFVSSSQSSPLQITSLGGDRWVERSRKELKKRKYPSPENHEQVSQHPKSKCTHEKIGKRTNISVYRWASKPLGKGRTMNIEKNESQSMTNAPSTKCLTILLLYWIESPPLKTAICLEQPPSLFDFFSIDDQFAMPWAPIHMTFLALKNAWNLFIIASLFLVVSGGMI